MSFVRVYSVHVDQGPVEVIFESEQQAKEYAADRSTDERATSASVTEFEIGILGTRRHVSTGQLAFIALDQEAIHAARAKERQRSAGGARDPLEVDRPQGKREPQARDQAAKAVGTSTGLFRQ